MRVAGWAEAQQSGGRSVLIIPQPAARSPQPAADSVPLGGEL